MYKRIKMSTFCLRKCHQTGLSNGYNMMLRTYIGESEHQGHCVRHQHQLTAVDATWSRGRGPIRVKIHLLIFLYQREEKQVKSSRTLGDHLCIIWKAKCLTRLQQYNSVFFNMPLLACNQSAAQSWLTDKLCCFHLAWCCTSQWRVWGGWGLGWWWEVGQGK